MSTKAEREKEILDSIGLKVVGGKTVIQYANGLLTEDGFEEDTECGDSVDYMCHWKSDDMLMKMEDLDSFLVLIINSKYLYDGLLWGIILNTWAVISRQLQEVKLSTPIIFFIGAPGTFKTSVARLFMTTGTYKNGFFKYINAHAFDSEAKFKKQIKGFTSSLVLMDDLHEVLSSKNKDKMQANIDTICREFYDYTNDCSLLVTAEKNVNLKFTDSFLQRVIWVDFPSKITKEFGDEDMYLDYVYSQSDDVLRILTAYQAFLLRQINDGHINSGLINKCRKTIKNQDKDKDKTPRQNDQLAIFEFSISNFYEFCKKNGVSQAKLKALRRKIEETKNRTILTPNAYATTFKEKIYHCLKFIGSRNNFLVTEAKMGKICVNFEIMDTKNEFTNKFVDQNTPNGLSCRHFKFETSDEEVKRKYKFLHSSTYYEYDEDDYDENADYDKDKYEENNEYEYDYDYEYEENIRQEEFISSRKYDNYIDIVKDSYNYHYFTYKHLNNDCTSCIHTHKYCSSKYIQKRYWPPSLYLYKDLRREAILIEDFAKVPFLNKYSRYGHDSLLIVNAESFINAIKDIYYDECEKYNIAKTSISKNDILNALNALGIIGYKRTSSSNKNENGEKRPIKNIYKFDFPGFSNEKFGEKVSEKTIEKVYILKLPDEIYKAISSNIENKPELYEREKEENIFYKFNKENEKILRELFYYFHEIKF